LVAEVQPSVFLVEMEDEVCASQIHTTFSFTSAEANTDEDEALPTVFLVMLEDGICASLSPISTTSRIAPEADRTKEKSIEQSDAVDSEQAALGAEMGVWYVQR